MIHEWRIYTLDPARVEEYLALAAGAGLRIRGERSGRLIGFWRAASGTLDQVHHVWEYESLDARQRQRAALLADPAWASDFLAQALPIITAQAVAFLEPLQAVAPPAAPGRKWICRRYVCRPGQTARFAAGLQRQENGPRHLWAAIAPDPNMVIELAPHDPSAGPPASPDPAVVRRCTTLLMPTDFSPLR